MFFYVDKYRIWGRILYTAIVCVISCKIPELFLKLSKICRLNGKIFDNFSPILANFIM